MKLTRRSLALVDGFASSRDKRELTQKLGAIEHNARELAEEVCEGYCMYRNKKASSADMELRCSECPMMRLLELIE
ncbi:MAG: hypothetical protein IKT52_00380 [Oscillospiraceae bacterium]|nr:hypothetical protein [Oscillospiraceae bacterium]